MRCCFISFRREVVNPDADVDPAEQSKVTAGQAWDSFLGLLQFSSLILTVTSQFVLIIHLSRRDSGGPLFALICLLRPLISTLVGKDNVWNRGEDFPLRSTTSEIYPASIVCLVRDTSKDHQRMEALSALTKPEYREDVISNNLHNFIVEGTFVMELHELYF